MRRTRPLFLLAALAGLAALLLPACAGKEPVEDLTMEKWQIMAEQSPGHSPVGQTEVERIEELKVEPPEIIDGREEEPQKPLPTFNISLRMHNADLVAVLQALSRAARQSVVVSPTVKGTVNVNVVEVPWDQVFKGILRSNRLAYNWEGGILRVMSLEDMEHDLQVDVLKKKRLAERIALRKTEPLSTGVIKVKFAEAEKLQKTLEAFLSKDNENKPLGSIGVDVFTNSLVIQAIAKDMEKLVKLISKLDRPRAQIKLKAYIVETTKDTARALGIQWGGMSKTGVGRSDNNIWITPGATGGTAGTDPRAGGYTPTLQPDNKAGISGQGYAMDFSPSATSFPNAGRGMALGVLFGKVGGDMLEMQLKALEDENKLNIISSPSITTMDNQKAYTESGEKVPYQTSSSQTGTNVQFQDVVLRLEITPHIIDRELIKLTVLIKKDEVDTSRTVDANPFIIKKATETTLIARDGETIVISGLSKTKSTFSELGLPGLKDVPGAGWLFKGQDKTNLKDEFLIFITPQILAEWKAGERQKSIEEIEKELLEKRKKEQEDKERGAGSPAKGDS
jgi:type IV pilus assembly protein PilQ